MPVVTRSIRLSLLCETDTRLAGRAPDDAALAHLPSGIEAEVELGGQSAAIRKLETCALRADVAHDTGNRLSR